MPYHQLLNHCLFRTVLHACLLHFQHEENRWLLINLWKLHSFSVSQQVQPLLVLQVPYNPHISQIRSTSLYARLIFR